MHMQIMQISARLRGIASGGWVGRSRPEAIGASTCPAAAERMRCHAGADAPCRYCQMTPAFVGMSVTVGGL